MPKEEINFVKWFSELNKNSGNIAGGKGANLAEVYNLKIPVPPGFVVTAQAYQYFMEKAGINSQVEKILSEIDYENTEQLDSSTREIRELIIKSNFPPEMEEEILEAYENLDTRGIESAKGSALDILKNSTEPVFVAVRSSATAEDLADASFAGQQDTFLNVKGKEELITSVRKCFASLFTSRATYYRNKKNFEHSKVSLAVVVQRMVDAEKSGVIFTKDPSYKNENTIIEAVWGLGEGIVSGKITPDRYIISHKKEITDKKVSDKKIAITRDSSGEKQIVKLKKSISELQVLSEHEILKLTEYALKLEDHYKKPQDVEFAIEGENIFIVQTRPITTIKNRIEKKEEKELSGEVILKGLAASPGIAFGKIKIVEEMSDLKKINKGDILVTKMTNPDMVVTMQRSSAIVTDEGGLTAHAAIVSREMGIPCIVGTREATTKLREGETITVDGFTGNIYKGKVSETEKKKVQKVTARTKTEIKVIVDLPSFAQRASETGLKKVGLTRIEGIIAESGKHPNYFLKNKNIKEYEEIIFKGIKDIAEHFESIWVRTSDIRSDEYQNLEGAPQEKEANPMLGMHGIRFGLKYPEVLKAELRALERVAENKSWQTQQGNENKKIGIILPQVISVSEVKEVQKILREIEFSNAELGVMIETPASVQLIKDLCREGIKFISFGTNDLTQYMLAVDRGNEEVQHIYNEMHPAILYQLEYVIRVCKRNNVKTSICGQAGSKKEMVKFLVEKGIDSISVNADMAGEISEYVAELEGVKNEKDINEEIENVDNEIKQIDEQIRQTSEKPEIRGYEKLIIPEESLESFGREEPHEPEVNIKGASEGTTPESISQEEGEKEEGLDIY